MIPQIKVKSKYVNYVNWQIFEQISEMREHKKYYFEKNILGAGTILNAFERLTLV